MASINGEGDAYKENTKRLDDYIKKLKEKALVQGAKKEMEKLGQEIAHTTVEVAKQEAALEKARKQREALRNGPTFTGSGGVSATGGADAMASGQIYSMETRLEGLKKSAEDATGALQTLSDKFGQGIAEEDLSGGDSKDKDGSGGFTYESEKDRKKRLAAEAKAERERKRQRKEAIQDEINDIRTAIDEKLAANELGYYKGDIDYREYMAQRRQITIDGLQQQMDVYKKYGDNSKQLEAEQAKELLEQKKDQIKLDVAQLEREYAKNRLDTQMSLYDPSSDMYHNEEKVNEELYKREIDYLRQKLALQKQIVGSEEAAGTLAEIDEMEQQHKLERAEKYEQKIQQYREQYAMMDVETQKRIALDGLQSVYDYEIEKFKDNSDEKLRLEREYQEMREQVARQYALRQSELNLQNSSGEKFKRNAESMYQTASNNAKAKFQNDNPTGTSLADYIASDATIYASAIANLKSQEADFAAYHQQLVKENKETQEQATEAVRQNHQEAMAAMAQATAEMCQGIAAKMQAAYDAISPIMDAMSSYYSAQCDLEVTKTEKKYEKQIEKAGNNSAKRKKLEEKQEKEIAKIKTKYAKKQAKMQIAQAIVTSAMSALNAYSSVMAGAPWPANMVLAPIAAGLALAAGAIQIATIKKQQQAQEAGYYEGGFTGGSSYRREAGVVHEGEFVANHNAVNNPQLLPALQLIDIAQRNNTVGSLTAADVSRSMGVSGTAIIQQTPVVVNNDNSELAGTLQDARETIDRLGALLESGDIIVKMPDWDDFDRSRRHYDNLQSNK